ncbi:hypothetical protein OW716_06795, partial [Acidithiobacillus ferriphilus]
MKQQGLMQATIYASAILAGTLWCASPAWADTASSSEAPPSKPVGQAPAEQSRPPAIETLISTTGVLTPAGKFVIEPFIQYRAPRKTFPFRLYMIKYNQLNIMGYA